MPLRAEFIPRNPAGWNHAFLIVTCELSLAADDVLVELQSSADFVNWTDSFEVLPHQPSGERTVPISAWSLNPAGSSRFARLLVREK
jgi:hypothetical protein